MRLKDFVPDADTFLALEPEDLGMILLKLIQEDRAPHTARSNLETSLWNENTPAYPMKLRAAVNCAFAEAWQWLQNEGLLMPEPEQPIGYFRLTRKGEKIRTPENIEAYRQGNLLQTALLHHLFLDNVRCSQLYSPKILEPRLRQLGVSHRVLNVAVAKVRL
jgi:hypothetical protein